MNTEQQYINIVETGHHLPEPQPDNSADFVKTREFLTPVKLKINQNEVDYWSKIYVIVLLTTRNEYRTTIYKHRINWTSFTRTSAR